MGRDRPIAARGAGVPVTAPRRANGAVRAAIISLREGGTDIALLHGHWWWRRLFGPASE
ncbi:MAG: hypothetical protein RI101_04340 [Nitrospira sp.]|nr:hypothetical protein [Nitrospira sp.]